MIIIAPFAKPINKPHPKNYPYWKEVIAGLSNEHIIQVGVAGEEQLVTDFRRNLSLQQLKELVLQCRTWVSVDSFFQHFCWDIGKPGVVIFGPSDPKIFGHPENINLLKDRKYLREKQFWLWEQCEYNQDAFVDPEIVINTVKNFKLNGGRKINGDRL